MTTALTLHQYHHNRDCEAETLDSLGFIAHRTGSPSSSITMPSPCTAPSATPTAWREALELYREQGRDTDAARVQRQLDELDTQSGTGDWQNNR